MVLDFRLEYAVADLWLLSIYALVCRVSVCRMQSDERGQRIILAVPCPAHPLSLVTGGVVSTVDRKPGFGRQQMEGQSLVRLHCGCGMIPQMKIYMQAHGSSIVVCFRLSSPSMKHSQPAPTTTQPRCEQTTTGAPPHSGKSPRPIGKVEATPPYNPVDGGPGIILDDVISLTVDSSSFCGVLQPQWFVHHSPTVTDES